MQPFTLYYDGKIIKVSSESEVHPIIRLCVFQNRLLFLLSTDFQLYKCNFELSSEGIHLKSWKTNIIDIELYKSILYVVNSKGTVLFYDLNELINNKDDDNDDTNWEEIIITKELEHNNVSKIAPATTSSRHHQQNEVVEIKRIKCNSIGKLFITKNNELYGCGLCGDVLTTEHDSGDDKPIKLKYFNNHKILDISAGEKFFVVLAINEEDCVEKIEHSEAEATSMKEFDNCDISLDNLSETNVDGTIKSKIKALRRIANDTNQTQQDFDDTISINSFCRTSTCSEDLETNLKTIVDIGYKLITTTVYSFGVKNDGLLGTGDHGKRSGVNVVVNLCERGVCSISSGKFHSLARTIDGNLFLWGLNTRNQIECSEISDLSGPKEYRGIGVNKSLTPLNILAACCTDYTTTILNTNLKLLQEGNQNNDSSNNFPKDFILHSVNTITNDTTQSIPLFLITKSFLLQNHQSFAVNYLKYFKAFQLSTRILIQNRQEIVCLKAFAERCNNNIGQGISLVIKLCQRYLEICCILTASLQTVEQFYRCNCKFWDLQFIKHTLEMIKIYELYTKCYCNVKSMNSFIDLKKSSYFNEFKVIEQYEKIFTQPFTQIFEFIKFIDELIKQQTDCKEILNEKLLQWELLLRTNRIDLEIADQTREFWLKNPKFEYLKQVNRRVILDSSKLQLKLLNGNKFTSNLFILFSDFLFQYGSQAFKYDLKALWIKIENETSIKCITPEKTFIVVAKTHNDKMIWYQELENSIKIALGKSINDKLPNVRCINYKYSNKHAKYPNADCKGQWKYGMMHGICLIKFLDGKIYHGNVRNGEIEGYGKMLLPSNATYEGYFKFGKFHDHGILETPDKRYEGTFRDGLFYGHGELITNSYTYIGEFAINTQSGYGVQEMIESGDKFMGLFAENKRSGIGVLLNVDSEYYEGIFADDKLAGEGIAIFDNGNYYEGEMTGTGPNGKGCFYVPNCLHVKKSENEEIRGNVITGILSGEWSEIQIQSGSVLFNQKFPELPRTIGEFTVMNNRKWRALFDDWETQVFGSTGITNVKVIWNKIAAYTTNLREIEKIKNIIQMDSAMGSYFAQNITLGSHTSTDMFLSLSSTIDKITHFYKSPSTASETNIPNNSKQLNNSISTVTMNHHRKSLSHEILFPHTSVDKNFDKQSINSTSSYFDYSSISIETINQQHQNNISTHNDSKTSSHSSSDYSSCNVSNSIPFLDYIPNVSIDSLMQNDVDTIKSYLSEAFRNPYHPLYALNERISHCFCKSYSCWKIKPSLMLADQAVAEWKSLITRIYIIVRKLFPTLPEESCYIEGSSEVVSHISLLYPILLTEKIYSLMLVLYAKKHLVKDEIYRQRLLTCEKKTDDELTQIICPDNVKSFLTIVENPSFKEAVVTLKQIEENYCPQNMLVVIENSMKLVEEAHSSCSSTSKNESVTLSADYIIPLCVFLVIRAGVIQIGAELSLLEDLLSDSINDSGGYAAYEHITSDNFFSS